MADINTSPAALTSDAERQEAVKSLYISNFDYIRELVYADPAATLDLEQSVAEGIARHLPSYGGKLNNAEFRVWLAEIIAPVVGFHAIMRVCEPFVRKAVWTTLRHHLEPSKYDDYPETVQELVQEVWCWVFLHLDELKTPGAAKLTTRVYERAKIMTMDWLGRQQDRRFAIIRRVYKLPSMVKMKKDAAEKLAADLDREAKESAEQETEAKEIQAEMKKLEMAA